MSLSFLQERFGIAPPPLTSLGKGLTLAQGFFGLYYVYQVRHRQRHHVDPDQILDEDLANTLTYGPATAIAYWANEKYGETSKVPKLLFAHFAKQLLSVFMNKAVKKPDDEQQQQQTLLVVAKSSVYYAIVSYLVGTNSIPGISDSNWGQVIFVIGQVGLMFHKYVAKEEPTEGGSRSLSTSGLYKYIEHPQQLFQIVSWVGIGLASQQFNAILQAGAVFVYSLVLPSSGGAEESGQHGMRSNGEKRYKLIPFVF
uniref:Steroid 5-alpha reductase C-terminal domain-containing protein n=1 Tax=Grammatophora oceanica TaxID=210454 RepID=A0A7S1VT39_9STRA|mmetsp:Transcript_6602/g.9656  ORF Transcript_6602/g.9656 Transcript_6602/m.9656 type:complete len:255 (+) Transcript_6602:79-843(+)|eukprot:CAMPEP_0194046470 /NCGR_PEP_ID=MMETSP0009_2-20130614/21132_1 /TAXON_ID=210454 /ORGANISM="Grammatophora oceanica, Strain CCMP 410" /LENGTH=254 /DNA_ID=CAMNT_0038691773 /DNA_START=79 /DNA_END=843 /DNA_ORIENTATION=+